METYPARKHFCNNRREAVMLLLLMCCCAASVRGVRGESSYAEQELFRSEKDLENLTQLGIKQVVFATRLIYDDPHWYANIGYYCDDENHKAYAGNGHPDESKRYLLDTGTGKIRVLLDGKGGAIRDPHVHYDGRTILFSYRRAGTDYYNLYEIRADGTGLRQGTERPYDDFEWGVF